MPSKREASKGSRRGSSKGSRRSSKGGSSRRKSTNVQKSIAAPKQASYKDIFEAIGSDDVDAVKEMLGKNKALVSEVGPRGSYPLHEAIRASAAMTKLLVESGADITAKTVIVKTSPNASPYVAGCPMAYFAGSTWDVSALKYMVSLGINLTETNSKGYGCVYMAAQDDRVQNLEYLIALNKARKAKKADGKKDMYPIPDGASLEDHLLDWNVVAEDNKSALYMASYLGHEKVVKLLLGAGADPLIAKKSTGSDPLMVAAYKNHIKVMDTLWASGKCQLDRISATGSTILHKAAYADSADSLNWILEKAAKKKISIDVNKASNNDKSTAIGIAATNGHLDHVTTLYTSGANASQADAEGWTPLHFAAFHGHTDIVKYLVTEAGVSPDVVTRDMSEGTLQALTAAELASQATFYDIVEWLLSREGRAKLEKVSDQGLVQILCSAAREGDMALVKRVLKEGEGRQDFDVNGDNHAGQTATQIVNRAAGKAGDESKWEEILEVLTAAGGNIFAGTNLREVRNRNPGRDRIHRRVWVSTPKSEAWAGVPWLWNPYVNSKLADFGRTPLHHAAHKGLPKWIDKLTKPGSAVVSDKQLSEQTVKKSKGDKTSNTVVPLVIADVNEPDDLGWTPLHEACDIPPEEVTPGHREAVKMLLERGAKPCLTRETTEGGWLPIQLTKDPETIKILLDAGSPGYWYLFYSKEVPRYTRFVITMLIYALGYPIRLVGSWLDFTEPIATVLQRAPSVFSESLIWWIVGLVFYAAIIGVPLTLLLRQEAVVDVLRTYVGALAVLVSLFLIFSVLRVRRDPRFLTIKKPSTRVRFNVTNSIDLLSTFVEYVQLISLPFIPNLGWPQGSPLVEIPLSLPAFLLQFKENRFLYLSLIPTVILMICWWIVSGYLGFCQYMRTYKNEKIREKYFPFIRSDFVNQAPLTKLDLKEGSIWRKLLKVLISWEQAAQLFGSAAFGTVVAVTFKGLDCKFNGVNDWTLEADESIACWTSDLHKWIAGFSIISLAFYIPTATFVAMFFTDSRDEDKDIRDVGLYRVGVKVAQLVLIVLATLFTQEPYVAVISSLVGAMVLFYMNVKLRPARELRTLNILRTGACVAMGWGALSAIVSLEFGGPDSLVAPIFLASGWTLILFVFLYLLVRTDWLSPPRLVTDSTSELFGTHVSTMASAPTSVQHLVASRKMRRRRSVLAMIPSEAQEPVPVAE